MGLQLRPEHLRLGRSARRLRARKLQGPRRPARPLDLRRRRQRRHQDRLRRKGRQGSRARRNDHRELVDRRYGQPRLGAVENQELRRRLRRRLADAAGHCRFAQEARNEGANFTILGNDEINADETFSKLAGSAAKGAVGASITTELEQGPALVEFEEEYKSQFGVDSTPFATATYDAVNMLAQVIEEHGTDTEAIRDGMEEVSGFEGLTGTLGFDRTGTRDDHPQAADPRRIRRVGMEAAGQAAGRGRIAAGGGGAGAWRRSHQLVPARHTTGTTS